MAARSFFSVLSRLPTARVIQPQASSKVKASSIRSNTVSSTLVRGGSRPGCLASPTRPDIRTMMPGVLIRLVEGTVTKIASAGVSMSPCNSAAVRWLSSAPGPARRTAAHSQAARGGGPLKTAYTPR